MAKLIYSTNHSLDGFIEDADGSFDWGVPSPELHQFFNDEFRDVGTHIYGRRLYETMAVWETMDLDAPDPAMAELQEQGRDFQQIWRSADKIVYSTTLEDVWTARTELRSRFGAADVLALKESSETDLIIGGAGLAAVAFASELVDEVSVTISPITLGSGKSAFPIDQRIELELIAERRFDNGAVNLKYRVV